MTVQFKNIRIRSLSGADVAAAGNVIVPKDFKLDLIYLVPRESQGSWVSHVPRRQGPHHRLRPERRALPRHAPAGPAPAARSRSSRSPSTSATPRACSGRSTASTSWSTTAASSSSGLYRVRDTDGDDKLDKVEAAPRSSTAAASTARTRRPLAPTASRCTSSAATRRKLTEGRRVARPADLGRGQPPAPHARRQRLHGRLARPRGGCICQDRPRRQGVGAGRRRASATRTTSPSTATASCSPTTPTWSGTSARPGTARRGSATSSAAAEFGWRNGAGKWPAYYPDSLRRGRRTSAPARRPASPSATARSSRRSTRTRSSSATGATASSTPSTSSREGASYTAEVEEFITGTPLPADRPRRQPAGRRDVLRHRRPQDAVGPVPRDLHRRRVDRARASRPPTPGRRARALRHKLEAFHGHADPDGRRRPPGPTSATPTASIRFAARVAIECQDPAELAQKALAETDPAGRSPALAGPRPGQRPRTRSTASRPTPSPTRRCKAGSSRRSTASTGRSLATTISVDLLAGLLAGLHPPRQARRRDRRQRLVAKFDPLYPARGPRPERASWPSSSSTSRRRPPPRRRRRCCDEAPTQEEQIDYALVAPRPQDRLDARPPRGSTSAGS